MIIPKHHEWERAWMLLYLRINNVIKVSANEASNHKVEFKQR